MILLNTYSFLAIGVVGWSLISLGAIGLLAAVILYFVAMKFKVDEDPRIDDVDEALPGANCGGCGYAGCRNFAESIIEQGSMEGFNCPVGGADMMLELGKILGWEAEVKEPQIAVVRCNGTCELAPKKVNYDGATSCFVANALFSGENGCAYGCLGCGDCVAACDFDAIHMDAETGLPVVNNKCVACGACVKACPRDIIELRNVGKKERRIYVCCVNKEKGALARKNCKVACIGCGACVKACKFDAITLEDNLAYIDYEKCKLCRKCAPVCPTDSIHELNFPPRKERPPKTEGEKPKPAVKKEGTETKTAAETKKDTDVDVMDKPKEGDDKENNQTKE